VYCAGNVARLGEESAACRILLGEPEGKSPLGKHRRRSENNIKLDLIYDVRL